MRKMYAFAYVVWITITPMHANIRFYVCMYACMYGYEYEHEYEYFFCIYTFIYIYMCVSAYTCRCQHMCIHARIHTSMHTNGNPHVGPQVYKLEMYSETGLAKSKKSSEHKMNHKSHTHTYTTVNPMVRSSRFMTVDINYVRAEKTLYV